MMYQLAAFSGDTIAVPQILFGQLARGEENLIRIGLYMISQRTTDPAEIARALRLKSVAAAQRALDFWYGAGLLEQADFGEKGPEPESSLPVPRLTAAEVAAASCIDPYLGSLMSECQQLLGGVISQSDTNILVGLYVNDKVPLETILLATAHAAAQGHRHVRYIERMVLSWKENGIVTGEDAERYLKLLEVRAGREAQVAETLGRPGTPFTLAEKKLIALWFEDYRYTLPVIQEAILYAGGKNTVRYINGILKNWYANGWHTLKEIQSAKALAGANLQPALPQQAAAPAGADRMARRKKPLEFLVEEG